MKKILINLFLLNFSFILFSQNIEFRGTVIDDETSSVIESAIVAIEGTALRTSTDYEGKFLFYDEIPLGEQIITITKLKYDTKYFIIDVIEGKSIVVERVELSLDKKEKARRKKLIKENENKAKAAKKRNDAKLIKLQKERDERLVKIRKQDEVAAKKLKKEKKKLKKLVKRNNVVIRYDESPVAKVESPTLLTPEPVATISPEQIKYGKILDVPAEDLTNAELYKFIDEWMGTTYLLGGETEDGIDCSSFSQRLYIRTFDVYIERTARKQYDSKYIDKFTDISSLKEGDLLFFKTKDENGDEVIGHVGIYLHNNKFVNSTSRRGSDGIKGVKISNLSERFWKSRFVAGGRRVFTD